MHWFVLQFLWSLIQNSSVAMSFKYLFVRYTEELRNMFCNEQLYVWVCSICWKQSLVKKFFFNWILQVFQTHWIWYIYCVYPYLYRSQLLGLMLYQSSLWLELINKQLGIFNLFSFFLVYFFLSLSWLLVDYR